MIFPNTNDNNFVKVPKKRLPILAVPHTSSEFSPMLRTSIAFSRFSYLLIRYNSI